ncbi:MAG: hypothetical protein J6Y20_12290 [Lachnospiraceae bacterium]|nr:hypothetical protein [Lachnospiraceae bacterium]
MLRLNRTIRTIPEESGELGAMVRAVRKSRGGDGVFCVMRSEATQGLMEIAPLLYARFEAKQHDIEVFGLARSKANAMELVRLLVDEMAKNGELRV